MKLSTNHSTRRNKQKKIKGEVEMCGLDKLNRKCFDVTPSILLSSCFIYVICTVAIYMHAC